MKFLIDECLSVRLTALLTTAGHDATHVVGQQLAGQPDEAVLAKAATDARVLLSADTDFGESSPAPAASSPASSCSGRADRSAVALVNVLIANLDVIAEDLDKGAFVVFTEDRIRIRRLPLI